MEENTTEDEEDRILQQVRVVMKTQRLWKHGWFILVLNLIPWDTKCVACDAEHEYTLYSILKNFKFVDYQIQ